MALDTRPYFGLGINGDIHAAAEQLNRARLADELGYDLFSVMDHPYAADRLEAYAALSAMLGATSRITGYVGVTNLPLRPAAVLARTLATLSALSGGRVVLGLGSGGFWQHITRMGVPHLRPIQAVGAFEEAIQLIRALTGGGKDAVSFDGRYYRVEGIQPAPVPTPPIWTGSNGPTALQVTGRLADGWIPSFGADWTSQRYRQARPLIDQAAIDAGRDPAEILTYYNVSGRLTPSALSRTRDEDGRWVGGSVEQWVEELITAVLEHGAAGFNTAVTAEDDPSGDEAARRFAAEVIPAVREAVHRERH
jgi:alkanesulfonate monooxygenase SsuD/methylene tetrahydromethanopterin reductase-like flavin-dependent oxidoreductase (luciferase family)